MIVEIQPNQATIANTSQTVIGAPGTISPATPVAFMWDGGVADWIAFR